MPTHMLSHVYTHLCAQTNNSRLVSQSTIGSGNEATADKGPAALTACNWNNYKTSCQYEGLKRMCVCACKLRYTYNSVRMLVQSEKGEKRKRRSKT